MRGAVCVSTPATFADFIMLVNFCGMGDDVNEFVGEFSKSVSDNITVTALKMKFMKTHTANPKKVDTKWALATLLDGYTHFCEMDDSTMFNKQTVRMKQYQKYVDSARISGKSAK